VQHAGGDDVGGRKDPGEPMTRGDELLGHLVAGGPGELSGDDEVGIRLEPVGAVGVDEPLQPLAGGGEVLDDTDESETAMPR
jgi:hypothetical protein